MTYNKDKKIHFNDIEVAIIFHTRDIPSVTFDIQYGFTSEDVKLDIERTLSHWNNWYHSWVVPAPDENLISVFTC